MPNQSHTQQVPCRVAVVAYSEFVFDIRIRNEAEALAEAGYLVEVVSALPRSGASRYRFQGISLHEVNLSIHRGSKARYLYQYLMFFLLASVLLLRLHAKQRFDFVHVHTLPDFLVFCAAPLKLTGTCVVLDLYEAMPEIVSARLRVSRDSMWFRLAAAAERASCAFADRLIAASDGIRDRLSQRGIPSDRFTVVYNSAGRRVQGDSPERLKIRLRLPEGKYLVHAGSINPERDLESLIRAIASAPLQDIILLVAGEGEPKYTSELGGLATALGIANRVLFTGNLTVGDARSLMSLSQVGVVTLEANPLTDLAWPMRILEFVEMNKPLVVPRLAFISKVLGQAAEYYTPGDPAGLTKALDEVLSNPGPARSRAQQALKACSRFTWENSRAALLRVYGDRQMKGNASPRDGDNVGEPSPP